MSKEVLQAIKAICDEKHIPVESVLSTIEQALAAAYRKDFGNRMQNLKVDFNPETMGIKVYDVKTVVEDQEVDLDEEGNVVSGNEEGGAPEAREEKKTAKPEASEAKKEGAGSAGEEEEEEERFNPKTQIMISPAREIKPNAEIGEELVQELGVPGEFGRMAAQTAKQVIIQRLREAEREVVFNEYKDKEGSLLNGTIQRTEAGNVLVDIGQATAVMPPQEQVRGEHYVPGSQLRFYIKSVATSSRGPEVIVSRSARELVRRLFEMEVPEIADGAVELKAIAREPGSRSKIAVTTSEENVDPVGSCVGQRGTRVQFIINELAGEKIDIIEWNADEKQFIKNALSPAKVMDVVLHEESRTAEALVGADQFSLAIGKQGQNVRLASSLTGWKIDIKDGTPAVEESDASARGSAGEAEEPASEAVGEPADEAAPKETADAPLVSEEEATKPESGA
ncbi:MAG: transcription termination factor NusA [Patescibacteria group bacterium]|nr:transcription termination factor NusA [bacterium]MDZ4221658.1 transcription termination factor NusA [Patescibacteria group bacterium]